MMPGVGWQIWEGVTDDFGNNCFRDLLGGNQISEVKGVTFMG